MELGRVLQRCIARGKIQLNKQRMSAGEVHIGTQGVTRSRCKLKQTISTDSVMPFLFSNVTYVCITMLVSVR